MRAAGRILRVFLIAYLGSFTLLALGAEVPPSGPSPSFWLMITGGAFVLALLFLASLGEPRWFWPDASPAVVEMRWAWVVTAVFTAFIMSLPGSACVMSSDVPALLRLGLGGPYEPAVNCLVSGALVTVPLSVIFGAVVLGMARRRVSRSERNCE